MATRRRVIRALPLAGLSGCTGGGSDARADADIVAGPDGRLAFEPVEVTATVGETLVWYFDSSGHNVSCVPDHLESVSLPSGGEPFSSYPGDELHQTVQRGETFAHTFETAGRFDYVCVPHAPTMAGTVRIEPG